MTSHKNDHITKFLFILLIYTTPQKATDNDNNTYAATELKSDLHTFTLPLKSSFSVHSVILQNIDQTFGENVETMRWVFKGCANGNIYFNFFRDHKEKLTRF